MNSRVYVHTGRDLGRVINSKGEVRHHAGNGLKPVQLHCIEYAVWKNVARMKSVTEWREAMAELIKSKTKVTIDMIEQRLLSEKLLHSLEFENEDDDDLVNIFVIRNGFSYGEREGIWVVAPHDNKTKLRLTREEHDIWIKASSYRCLLDIIADVLEERGCTVQEAVKVVSDTARKFIRVELWTAEYLPGEDL